jgi:hypothetical protein
MEGVFPATPPPLQEDAPLDPKIIRIGDEGQLATRELTRRFEAFAERHPGLDSPALRTQLRTLESIDRQYGGHGALPLEDVEDLAAASLTELAHLAEHVRRASLPAEADVADLTLGVALWATRHEVPIPVVEPVANALAVRSNEARGKAALSAVFGLMQGVIANVAPRLAPDLERSNPERPWRVLHANLAITAIRSEDPALMDFAFDALDGALPDERASFYAEALALALGPRIDPAVRDRIEARHRKWAGG